MKSSSFLIEHQCPQCGAPAILEETDHLFTCQYCRVKSYLLSPDFFRYMFPHSSPGGKSLIFLPYWRFKGCFFSCTSGGIRQRIVDISHQGILSSYFPVSLGLRSQTLKLRFASQEDRARFLKPSLPYHEALHLVEKRFSSSLPEPVFARNFLGETMSLIFSPFYVDGRIYDAILKRPVSPVLPQDFDIENMPSDRTKWKIKFVPALCPNCGWDLEGARDSLALNCKNCDSVWLAGKKGFTRMKFGSLPLSANNATYLPFYRIRTQVTGMDIDSYADLIRVSNLPKVIQEGWEKEPFWFWSPAFKIRPQDMLRFSRNLTLFQPRDEVIPELPEGEIYPVTLPVREAVDNLKIILASFMKPQKVLLPRLPEIDFKPRSFLLVYIPFQGRGSELTQPSFQLRVNKNLLSFARYL
ncbi:MAG: hypothetical protein JRI79_07880 [Deltaproteobacteria bacterium]|nr:hypothetical protein [Deltaproteobacteria bacterium]MBW1934986.1 hypothetical protein [Deltaproteobacteria bacterium]MBW1977874.1 hypothetical protein [Deltaproteobacteria bacterium]MBW2046404.1 hypothetical protein [Deltaproteobacteria bacterium]MBW2300612.1 hypothetical protein [Deltaproteobacteria bacterium]